jgi:hypothetical protein
MKSLLASPDFASELLGQDTSGQLNKSILLIGGSNINPMSAPASGQETQSMHDWVRTVRTESPPENWRLICKAGRSRRLCSGCRGDG